MFTSCKKEPQQPKQTAVTTPSSIHTYTITVDIGNEPEGHYHFIDVNGNDTIVTQLYKNNNNSMDSINNVVINLLPNQSVSFKPIAGPITFNGVIYNNVSTFTQNY